MKIQLGRNELLTAVQAVIGVVERRQTLPVLSNLLVDAQKDELVITGTDLEIELVSRAVVKCQTPGKTTVPARKLFDICRGLPEGADLTLESSGDKVTLRSGKSRFTLAALRPDEFPSLGTVNTPRVLKLQKKELRALIERTQFAMAHQDVRYYLNGMLFHVSPKHLRAVATDGHRLAMSELSRETKFKDDVQIILPRKAVLELLRLLEPTEDLVELRLGDSQFQADLDVIRLTSKLIDGRFPDYERVLPEGGDKKLTASRERVRQALSRAAILSNEKFRGVRLQLSDAKLRLSTHNPEHEEAEEELDVTYKGAPLEIGFNVNYLLDALAVMETENFVMDLKGPDASGLLQEAGSGASKYVVMPMRL
ncbi:MAG TPA: DNA polymerase III subunit beta [Candidatus Binatia bacterium]|nr:DNA polymerase III subunit beta [Candidatus Binatia bacterium]